MRARLRSTAVLLLAALPAAGCGGGEAADAPASALLVTIDTLRADAVGAYGGREGLTPHLDRLAEEGVLFERAYATVPLTLPSHASMLTGLNPLRHGVRDNGYEVLPEAAVTLAEVARRAGVATAAYVSATVLHPDFGLDQGFELFDSPEDDLKRTTTDFPSRRADEVVTDALAWLGQRDRSRPFLLWVHLWDVHKPWEPAPEFRARAPGNPYLQEVASADAALGRLLAGLRDEGTLDATTVVVVADHGESLHEHGEAEHGVFCYDATMRVPLLLRPNAGHAAPAAGTRVTRIASVVDVAPTLAAGLGLPPLADVDGLDLHAEVPPDRGAYLESYYAYRAFGWSPIAGWVDGRAKYLHSTLPELYDPVADPREEIDRIGEHGDLAARARDVIGRLAALPALPREDAALSDERRADLRALGYAAAGGSEEEELPHPLATTDRPAPTQRVEVLADLETAYQFLDAQQYPSAERAYRRILAVDPGNLWAEELLATALLAQGRPAEAVAPLERVVAGGRATAIVWGNLGHALAGSGRPEAAVSAFREALELNPTRVGALRALVRLAEDLGTPRLAQPYIERYEHRTEHAFAR